MAVAYDCEPTLSDTQVLEFCKKGFLVLKGVVPEEINKKTVEFLKEDQSLEPNGLMDETWFVDNVIKNLAAAGAVRSLLGRDFGLPNLVSNHRIVCPQPAQSGTWIWARSLGRRWTIFRYSIIRRIVRRNRGRPRCCPGPITSTRSRPTWVTTADPRGQAPDRARRHHIHYGVLDLASAQRFHRRRCP